MYPNSDAKYVVPQMSLMIMNTEIELNSNNQIQHTEHEIVEGITKYLSKSIGVDDVNVINSELKQFANGKHITMELEYQYLIGHLLDSKNYSEIESWKFYELGRTYISEINSKFIYRFRF